MYMWGNVAILQHTCEIKSLQSGFGFSLGGNKCDSQNDCGHLVRTLEFFFSVPFVRNFKRNVVVHLTQMKVFETLVNMS